jgi:hypothetical protein
LNDIIFVWLLVCSVFNDAFNDSDHIASNEGVISELRIGKDVDESGRDLILRYYRSICLEGVRKPIETPVRTAGLRAEM